MTRYPKSGKGTKWSVKELNALGSDCKGDTLSDGDGLFGDVRINRASVTIVFKYAFRWNSKVSWHYCGSYPDTDLQTIRKERNKARSLAKSGVDPRVNKKAEKIDAQALVEATIKTEELKQAEKRTFNDLYDVWIKDGVNRSDSNKYLQQSFSKHVLPALGSIELKSLTENHLRDLYRSVVTSGKNATAVELSKDVKQMLSWAEKRKPWRKLLEDGNPSDLVDVSLLLPHTYTKERSRILSPAELKNLKSIFETITAAYNTAPNKYEAERPLKKEVQIALWLCLGTLCRIGELLKTEWQHVDFQKRTWFIPAANTKGERGKKSSQLVYLSNFTCDQFKQLHALTGDSVWAFPARYQVGPVNVKSTSKLVGDRQAKFKQRTRKLKCRVENDSLVLGSQEWTPHDLRRTGATMMQKLRINRDVINLCQNHVIGTKVDRVYLLDDYADQKNEAWNKLGDEIEKILM